jgi:BirA family transcriptional regulator, biotin operon repressor / biotin---[acetyl-CoA-carboxylase] ligase
MHDNKGSWAGCLAHHGGCVLNVQRFAEIDSTNAEALRQLKSIAEGEHCAPSALIAESQTAGRGRRGRAWLSKPGAGLYLSLVRTFSLKPDALQGLSLVVGLAVQSALTLLGASKIKLKWPNDIIHEGRKLGGILLELRQVGDLSHVVMGIGINLNLGEKELLSFDRPTVDLSRIIGGEIDKEALCVGLLNQLSEDIDRFIVHGFESFIVRWNEADYYLGKRVTVLQGQECLRGVSCGVDASGALMLKNEAAKDQTGSKGEDTMLRFEGGELSPSLRPEGE